MLADNEMVCSEVDYETTIYYLQWTFEFDAENELIWMAG